MHVSLFGAIDVAKPRAVETRAATSAAEPRVHAVLRVPGKATAAVEAWLTVVMLGMSSRADCLQVVPETKPGARARREPTRDMSQHAESFSR